MLNDDALCWVTDGDASVQQEALDKIYNTLKQRCLDLEDFMFDFAVNRITVAKKRRIIM
jgi:hypothetical protein